MDYSPKYLGPGYWASWHIKSIHADTQSKKGEVARNIALDIKNFPCLDCQTHAKYYVSKNPLITAVNSKDKLSIFKWIVDFHNEVNLRLGKKIFTYEEALLKWNGNNFCSENCDGEKEKVTEAPEKPPEEKVELEENKMTTNFLIKNYN